MSRANYWVECIDNIRKNPIAIDCSGIELAIAVAYINIYLDNCDVRVVNSKGELVYDEEAIMRKFDANDPVVMEIFKSIKHEVNTHYIR